ncbi:MAG TPA: cytochrome c oxidase subunit 3 family protein [Gemmataceae bacterium]|nr:cytochrome c oxidase subunit 3 family protein [Gemmataceae bacterium]
MSEVVTTPQHGGAGEGGPFLAHHFENLEQQRAAESLGMWAFLATEILFFGALFTGYIVYRAYYSASFEAASGKLNILIGAINTVVLLTSSLTMALAVHAAHTGLKRMLVTCLGLTAALGALFLVFKGIEYYTDWKLQLVPVLSFNADEWTTMKPPVNPQHVQLFLMFYYILTLLHAVHLTVGIGLILTMMWLAQRGAFPPANYGPVDVAGLYWHFIDVVWIFLLPLLYLIGTHTVGELNPFTAFGG